jgi:hypothetical protein
LTNPLTRFGLLFGLALLLALGLGYFLFQQEQRLALGVWPGYTPDLVQSIEVATRKERYTLMREQGGWVVRLAGAEADAPPVPADPARVEALLQAIAHNRPTQNVEPTPGADLSTLGFDDPAVRILVRPVSSDLHEVQYTLGHETPTGAALYAHSSLAPDTVFLLDASVLHQFDKPSEHFFDARLIDVRGEDAQNLTLASAAGVQWELDRKDDQFVFLKPDAMRNTTVSSSEVRLYLHNLTALTADAILTKPGQQVTGKPACVIEILQQKTQTAQRLELYPPLDADQVYGRSTRHPLGFLLEREKAKNLLRQAYDMQWRGVISFDSAQVEGARVYSVSANQTLLAEKTPAGWEDRERGRMLPGIDMTLWRLKELRFEAEPVSRLGYPAAQRLVLDLLGRDGKVLSSFTFFSDPRLPADQCWLKVGSEEMYYPVTSQLLEDVQGFMPARAPKNP